MLAGFSSGPERSGASPIGTRWRRTQSPPSSAPATARARGNDDAAPSKGSLRLHDQSIVSDRLADPFSTWSSTVQTRVGCGRCRHRTVRASTSGMARAQGWSPRWPRGPGLLARGRMEAERVSNGQSTRRVHRVHCVHWALARRDRWTPAREWTPAGGDEARPWRVVGWWSGRQLPRT